MFKHLRWRLARTYEIPFFNFQRELLIMVVVQRYVLLVIHAENRIMNFLLLVPKRDTDMSVLILTIFGNFHIKFEENLPIFCSLYIQKVSSISEESSFSVSKFFGVEGPV